MLSVDILNSLCLLNQNQLLSFSDTVKLLQQSSPHSKSTNLVSAVVLRFRTATILGPEFAFDDVVTAALCQSPGSEYSVS